LEKIVFKGLPIQAQIRSLIVTINIAYKRPFPSRDTINSHVCYCSTSVWDVGHFLKMYTSL